MNTNVSIAGAILWGVLRCARPLAEQVALVSIAGAILWGVLLPQCPFCPGRCWFQSQGRFFGGCCSLRGGELTTCDLFQSQGRFFGGCCPASLRILKTPWKVSIAGAILWGVLRERCLDPIRKYSCFNRRGDSLGGAAFGPHGKSLVWFVSIAGAILWGVLPTRCRLRSIVSCCFNRRGDSLGGAAPGWTSPTPGKKSFNRRGDSLGGAAQLP